VWRLVAAQEVRLGRHLVQGERLLQDRQPLVGVVLGRVVGGRIGGGVDVLRVEVVDGVIGLVVIGLVRIGLVRIGLIRIGLIRIGLIRIGLVVGLVVGVLLGWRLVVVSTVERVDRQLNALPDVTTSLTLGG
jgi:hypothetical protein